MKKCILLLFVTSLFLFSCEHGSNSTAREHAGSAAEHAGSAAESKKKKTY